MLPEKLPVENRAMRVSTWVFNWIIFSREKQFDSRGLAAIQAFYWLLEIYYTHYREVIRSRRFETTSWLPDVISLEVIAQKHEPNPFGFELGLLAKASYQGHATSQNEGVSAQST